MSNDWKEAKRKVEEFQEMMEELGLGNDYWTEVESQEGQWKPQDSSVEYGKENDCRPHR